MPIFTRTFTIIASLLTVPVFAFGVIGANYNSPFLNHLADIVNGSSTQVVASLNAPNWGYGIPIQSPSITTVASSSFSSAASGLASSTLYYFAVAAVDGNGTTTIASTASFMTDASTTQARPEVINLSWNPVNGATGYAIYFSTTTPTLDQYFLATSSNQYAFATSTGSKAGSYTKTDTTAFSELLTPSGPDIFNDNTPLATSSIAASTTAAQFGGTIDATASATTTACEADTAGAVFFNTSNSHEWGCNGTTWTKIF